MNKLDLLNIPLDKMGLNLEKVNLKNKPKKKFAFLRKVKKQEFYHDESGKKTNLLFSSFFIEKWKEIEYRKLKNVYEEDNRKDLEELLIKEISKPIINHHNPRNKSIYANLKILKDETNNKDNKMSRDSHRISFLLKQYPGFVKFMKFNGINDDDLLIFCQFVRYVNYPKNNYIFRQGELSFKFYGLIKGLISIRTKRPENKKDINEAKNEQSYRNTIKKSSYTDNSFIINSKKIKKFSDLATLIESGSEEEVMKISNGMCFGEWGIIDTCPRTASAFTLEDCHLFFVDKEFFEISFFKSIVRADIEKRKFITNHLSLLKREEKTSSLLKKLVPIFCSNKNIIYTEFDKADHLYIVYQGECKLQKLYFNRIPLSKDEIYENSGKMITMLILERGGMAGLEICEGCENYKYNLVSNRDQTIVYKISLKVLNQHKLNIIENLKPLSEIQKNQLQTFIKDHERFSSKMRINYNYLTEKKSLDENINCKDNTNKTSPVNYLKVNKIDVFSKNKCVYYKNSSNFKSKSEYYINTDISIKSSVKDGRSPVKYNNGTISFERIKTYFTQEIENVSYLNTDRINSKNALNQYPKIENNEIKNGKIFIKNYKMNSSINLKKKFKGKIQNVKIQNNVGNLVELWESTIKDLNYNSGVFNLPLVSFSK